MAILDRPKLRNSIFVVPGAEKNLQIRSSEKTLKVTGDQVELLSKVIAQLKESREIAEVAANLPEYPQQTVFAIVERLSSLGLLEDTSEQLPNGFSDEEAAYYSSQLQFFSLRAKDRFAHQLALKNARVVAVGLGRIGSVVVSNLLGSGVGRLRGFDARRVDEQDLGPVYNHHDRNLPRADAILTRLGNSNPFVKFTAESAKLDSVDDVKNLIEDCDLLIVCEDDPAVRVFETVNDACLQKKVRWLGVSLFGSQGVIGPMVVPGDTPCYRCYKLRERSNAPHLEEYVSFENYLRDNPDHNVKQGGLRLFENVVGSLAALEAVYALTGLADPRSVASLLTVDLYNLEIESHPVLRLPRCPSCSPTRDKPKRKVFDM